MLFLEKNLFFLVFRAFRGLYIIIYIRHGQASRTAAEGVQLHERTRPGIQDSGGRCADLSEHGQASRTAAKGVQLHEWHGQASRREAGGIFPPTRKAGREERPQCGGGRG